MLWLKDGRGAPVDPGVALNHDPPVQGEGSGHEFSVELHRALAGENRGAPVDSHTGCVSFSSLPSGSAETVLTQSFSPTFVQHAKRPVLHSCLLVESSDAALV